MEGYIKLRRLLVTGPKELESDYLAHAVSTFARGPKDEELRLDDKEQTEDILLSRLQFEGDGVGERMPSLQAQVRPGRPARMSILQHASITPSGFMPLLPDQLRRLRGYR